MTGITAREIINNRYILENMLGEGGMGEVYRSHDRLTGKIVALKRVQLSTSPKLMSTGNDTSSMLMALTSEFRTLASLRHPHIISVLDYGFDEERRPYFTMEYIENAQELHVACQERDIGARIELIIQVLQALAYLHHHDLLHRDLKPENILVQDNERVRLLDFGLAIEQTQAKGLAGTLNYMAPELLKQEAATPATDLYAVGVILYLLLAGKFPFKADTQLQLFALIMSGEPDMSVINMLDIASIPEDLGTPTIEVEDFDPTIIDLDETFITENNSPPSNLSTSADNMLTLIISRLLAKDPAARYQRAEKVIQDLCEAVNIPVPEETFEIRESFLQTAKFVGRTQEFEKLQHELDALKNRQIASAWLIGGEVGVGKSRLIEEIRTWALVQGFQVVRGQGLEGGGLSYQLWRDALPYLILNTELGDLEAGIIKAIVPNISDLLGRNILDVPDLPGGAGKQRLHFTIEELIRRQPRPVMLILEDLQWTIESRQPLQHLMTRLDQLPLMIACTYRSDEAPDLPQAFPNIETLQLERLDADAIEELSSAMLGETGQQADILHLLQQETEGNAFFVVEVVRALAEEAGRLSAVGQKPLPTHIITSGIENIIQRRLDKVPVQHRYNLAMAASLGRRLDLILLKHLFNAQQADLDNFLYACDRASVLDVQDGIWRFAHEKLRDGVLNTLDKQDTVQLYAQIAQAIETVYPDNDEYVFTLVKHWQLANNPAKEAEYAFKAGQRATRMGLIPQARAYLERALEITTDAQRRGEILRILGNAWRLLHDFEQARACFTEALTVAEQHNDLPTQARARDGLSQVAYFTGDHTGAIEMLKQSVEIYREANDRIYEGYALQSLGMHYRNLGQIDLALDLLTQATEIAQDTDDVWGLGIAYNNLGYTQMQELRAAPAVANMEKAIAIARQAGYEYGVANRQVNLAITYHMLGKFAEAEATLHEALAIHRKMNSVYGQMEALQGLGDIDYARGNYEQALTYFAESWKLAQSIGIPEIGMLIGLCKVHTHNQDFVEALDYGQQALEIAEKTGRPHDIGQVNITLTWLFMGQEDFTTATQYAESAFALDVPDIQAEAANFLGLFSLQNSNSDKARDYFIQAKQQLVTPVSKSPEVYRLWYLLTSAELGSAVVNDEDLSKTELSLFKGLKIANYAGLKAEMLTYLTYLKQYTERDLSGLEDLLD